MPDDSPIVRLALEDGTIFTGRGFGACGEDMTSTGEVVFCTAMCGYQEALTDPSYAGQILTMTAPMIGNYGVNDDDIECGQPQVAGFVVRELSRRHSNYRASQGLSEWLEAAGVLGIEGIDTRALVRRIRTQGAMRGVISSDQTKTDLELIELAQGSPSMEGLDLASSVSVNQLEDWSEGLGDWAPVNTPGPDSSGPPLRVLAIDCGGKRNIYRHLTQRGCLVRIAPLSISAAEIRAWKPDGIFISNGPGDPSAVEGTIGMLRDVAGEIPTFGICLGHQLLALAVGASTFKLKFGHRGANQPVRNLLSGRVEITSQNHGFAVDPASFADLDCEITHEHLNDGTVAGFRHRSKPVFSVQFHPEASPGPHDSAYLFNQFIAMMRASSPTNAAATA